VSFEHICTTHCVKEHLVEKGSVETVVKGIFTLIWFLFQGSDLQNWNTWDDSPVSVITERSQSTIQQQIDLYRQQATRHGSESEEPQPDFFEVCHWKFIMRILHVCTVLRRWLKHFIIQQMHKYIIRRYS